MDMKKILTNLDNAQHQSVGNNQDMRRILESFNRVASEPVNEVASMNISMSGETADEVSRLMKLMGNDTPEVAGNPGDIGQYVDVVKSAERSGGCGSMIKNSAVEEDWDNSPEEEYTDHEYMIRDLSGGINREKRQYKAAQPGDNAMAVKEGRDDDLMAMAIRALPEDLIMGLAKQLHDGEISLEDFTEKLESEAYTEYSMRRGESGLDQLDHHDEKAWDREKSEWDWDDMQNRDYEDDDFSDMKRESKNLEEKIRKDLLSSYRKMR